MVGRDTYLGSQVIVVPGTTIGSQCVLGANSFVNMDVPDRTIVAGSPARPIGRVEVTDQVHFVYDG
jgi:acetyltransferase-like isoleucine patch superfamily enzyme